VTEETVAVNPALVAFAGTVTVAGTFTAASALDSAMAMPLVEAAEFMVTVQESVPDPVRVELLQVSFVNSGIPVPLRFTAMLGLVDDVLFRVNCPLTAPEITGWNCTSNVAV